MRIGALFLLAILSGLAYAAPPEPNVKDIIQKSVAANWHDFEAAPHFNHKERDRDDNGDRTFQVTMIDGSPYQRLIAVNGKPLSQSDEAKQLQKEADARKQRDSESESQRQQRIQKYQQDRKRDQSMMGQLTIAFNFNVTGQRVVRGHNVWVLHAYPKKGYQPPNRDTEVLTGMQGEMWIDQKTFQWVRVTAQVIHPVSIEGFLAEVEPGTRFELEKAPVGDSSVWMPSHFSERAMAKVLMLFNHREHEDNTFWDYQPAK